MHAVSHMAGNTDTEYLTRVDDARLVGLLHKVECCSLESTCIFMCWTPQGGDGFLFFKMATVV